MTAQASGRQGWLAPACQLGNRSLFWATNRLTHGFLQRYQIFPQPFSIPSSGSALGRYCKRLRVYPVSLQSPWVNLYAYPIPISLYIQLLQDSEAREERHSYILLIVFLMRHCPVTVVQRYRDGVCSLLFHSFFIICHPYIPLQKTCVCEGGQF